MIEVRAIELLGGFVENGWVEKIHEDSIVRVNPKPYNEFMIIVILLFPQTFFLFTSGCALWLVFTDFNIRSRLLYQGLKEPILKNYRSLSAIFL